jgi:hypothetical protein
VRWEQWGERSLRSQGCLQPEGKGHLRPQVKRTVAGDSTSRKKLYVSIDFDQYLQALDFLQYFHILPCTFSYSNCGVLCMSHTPK